MINAAIHARRTAHAGRQCVRIERRISCRASLFIRPQLVKSSALYRTQIVHSSRLANRNDSLKQTAGNRTHLVQRRAHHHSRPQLERQALAALPLRSEISPRRCNNNLGISIFTGQTSRHAPHKLDA